MRPQIIISALVFSLLGLVADASAEKPADPRLCTTKKGVIRARAKCKNAEKVVNFSMLKSGDADFTPPSNGEGQNPGGGPLDTRACYWRLGEPTPLAGPARQVTFRTMCNENDIAFSHALEHNDLGRRVSISSIQFEARTNAIHPLPQGVAYRLNITEAIQGGVNAELGVLCCSFLSSAGN